LDLLGVVSFGDDLKESPRMLVHAAHKAEPYFCHK
jgi:hypothetical protein